MNDEKIFAKTCSKKRLFLIEPEYRHTTQIGCLNVEKKVKWGARQFFSGPDAVQLGGLLFCSERTRQLLAGQWDGLEFWPVKKYKTDKVVPDLFQLIFTEELPMEAISGGKLEKCRGCGKEIMRFNKGVQNLTLRKEFLTDPYKVYCTGDVLVPEQLIACETFSLNIVSQEFYRYCEKRQMNRGMIYEPIKVI